MRAETSTPLNFTLPPFTDVLVQQIDGQYILHPEIQDLLTKSQRRCTESGICAHDLHHSMRTTENGFQILDMFIASAQTNAAARNIPLHNVVMALYLHDVGYGKDNVRVIGKEVEGHEEASWQHVHDTQRRLPYNHPSRMYIAHHEPMLQAGILGTAKDYRTIIEEYRHNPTPNTLFQLLIAAADKADYFMRQRVQSLPKPRDMANPYHVLAYAVKDYKLLVDPKEKMLRYTVSLHTDDLYYKDVASWEKDVRTHCRQVFALLEAAAASAGYAFKVEDERRIME